MESMKMEIEVKANKDGIVKAIYVKPGQFVAQGAPLILIE
jgi:Acetyl/propionyl-CoA carboxylase, alpha subunit